MPIFDTISSVRRWNRLFLLETVNQQGKLKMGEGQSSACGEDRKEEGGVGLLDGESVRSEWGKAVATAALKEMHPGEEEVAERPIVDEAEVKAFIDRVGYVLGPERALERKPVAAVAAVRRGGAVQVVDAINQFFMINGAFIVSGTYWNMGYGRNKGEVLGDEEGLRNMRSLGENMAWLLKKLA